MLIPNFLVDNTAGKLCRWLRILGFDTAYTEANNNIILHLLWNEKRILITRNLSRAVKLEGKAEVFYLEEDNYWRQLVAIVRHWQVLEQLEPFTLCSVCNTQLEEHSSEQAKKHIPDFVYKKQELLGYCPNCDKYYWKGTHWQKMSTRREELILLSKSKEKINYELY